MREILNFSFVFRRSKSRELAILGNLKHTCFWDVCTATPGASRRGEDESEREQVITTFITGANEKQEAAKRQRKAAEEKAASLGFPHQIVFIGRSHVSHSITVVSSSSTSLRFSFKYQRIPS